MRAYDEVVELVLHSVMACCGMLTHQRYTARHLMKLEAAEHRSALARDFWCPSCIVYA
jgi:hypothetical protein